MSVFEFLIAVLPIFLIGMYIYKKDRLKESSGLLFKLFLGGIAACFPAATIGMLCDGFFPEMDQMNFIQLLFYVFFVISFVEEIFKWIFLYKISYNSSEFDSLYDMIVYAAFVALGFACFENILYVYSSNITTGLVRAVSAVPGHVCDGILMGSYLSLSKVNEVNGNLKLAKKYKILSILMPVITHFIYDYCLFLQNPIFLLLFLLFVVNLFIICFKKVKNISRNNYKFIRKNNYCTNCGNHVGNNNYCTVCGKKNN